MSLSSKKYKEKECRKRKHRSRSRSESEDREREHHKERKHKHKKHHKEKRREKAHKHHEYESHSKCLDSDIIERSSNRIPTPPPPRIDTQPEPSGQSSESLSIEETNRLRAKLGLKPLDVNADNRKSDGKKKDDLGEFYHKPATNLSEKHKQEKFKAKLAEHKEKQKILHKLSKTKTLGDSDNEEDVSAWVYKSRQTQTAKEEADKREKILQELDEQFGVSDVIDSEVHEKRKQKYTGKNLKGLQVEHDIDDIAEERSIILTLKDQNVLDKDEDVLVNVNILDNERYRKNVENLKKKVLYNAYDNDEFDQFGNPQEKSLLGKYDIEIDGEKRQNFRIGHDFSIERKKIVQSVKDKLANKRIESLSGPGLTLASEYYNEDELAKFKKPKKKVRKIRAKGKILTADNLEHRKPTGIEDIGTRRVKKEEYDIDDVPSFNFNPDSIKIEEKDDHFERALEKTKKMQPKPKLDVVSAVKTIKEELPEELEDGSNITLNATAEFCRTLGDIPTYGKAGNRDESVDEMIDYEKNENNSDDDCQIISDDEGGRWNSVDPNEQKLANIKPTEVPILDEEPDVGSGVGAALKLAMSKGYLDKEQNNRPSNSRLAHLQAKHYSIEDKSYSDEVERSGARRERYTGPVQEFREKDTFKPNVKLEYIDDEGHILNSKEAFRYLSHKFHGKGPSKNKIEKRLKKSQQEGLMKKMSSTDTPLGTLNMLQAKQKEMQSPYIVLSGGKHTHSTTISKQRR